MNFLDGFIRNCIQVSKNSKEKYLYFSEKLYLLEGRGGRGAIQTGEQNHWLSRRNWTYEFTRLSLEVSDGQDKWGRNK